VGMGKAAFCAAFQARRAGTRVRFRVFERHFHSELSNFQNVSPFWSFSGVLGAEM
jgi:hypothetical protein